MGTDDGHCLSCRVPLDRYGKGATRRFINRGATAFYCTSCLAALFKMPHEELMEKIVFLKQQGCSLFS